MARRRSNVIKFPTPDTTELRLAAARKLAKRDSGFRDTFKYWADQYAQRVHDGPEKAAAYLKDHPVPVTIEEAEAWRCWQEARCEESYRAMVEVMEAHRGAADKIIHGRRGNTKPQRRA